MVAGTKLIDNLEFSSYAFQGWINKTNVTVVDPDQNI